ncbi:MAG: DUF362 domain-containing protein [Candidatus Geothermincolia bacterium]
MVSRPVSLAECEDYERATVEENVARVFDLLGGAGSIAGNGASVFVKVNNVIAAGPETGIVTHPEVARAVIEQFKRAGARVAVGDSPGGPFTPGLLKRVYEKTGIAGVARETGVELALDTGTVDVPFPQGASIKRISMCRAMMEADCLVSVSKFKTHRYMNVTGPIKNLYGAVPGTTKFVYHSRFDDDVEFANLIVDVHLAAKPAFHVLDAVEVTEGEGSRHGTIRKMRCLAASRDAFALESLVMHLAGLDASCNKVLSAAVARGLCAGTLEGVEVLGADPAGLILSDFVLPEKNFFSEKVPAVITERLSRLVAATPEPVAESCTLCGRCVDFCPRGAMSLGVDVAVVDARKCIRCFCCDELCEQQAIEISRPLLARMLKRNP